MQPRVLCDSAVAIDNAPVSQFPEHGTPRQPRDSWRHYAGACAHVCACMCACMCARMCAYVSMVLCNQQPQPQPHSTAHNFSLTTSSSTIFPTPDAAACLTPQPTAFTQVMGHVDVFGFIKDFNTYYPITIIVVRFARKGLAFFLTFGHSLTHSHTPAFM